MSVRLSSINYDFSFNGNGKFDFLCLETLQRISSVGVEPVCVAIGPKPVGLVDCYVVRRY